jgi:hypothetical protein
MLIGSHDSEPTWLVLTMSYKFCTIRFKDRSGLGSSSIFSHFWTTIYLGPWHFVKNYLDQDPLPPLHMTIFYLFSKRSIIFFIFMPFRPSSVLFFFQSLPFVFVMSRKTFAVHSFLCHIFFEKKEPMTCMFMSSSRRNSRHSSTTPVLLITYTI